MQNEQVQQQESINTYWGNALLLKVHLKTLSTYTDKTETLNILCQQISHNCITCRLVESNNIEFKLIILGSTFFHYIQFAVLK